MRGTTTTNWVKFQKIPVLIHQLKPFQFARPGTVQNKVYTQHL